LNIGAVHGHPATRSLVIADYSQIELRILAEFSGDEVYKRIQIWRRSAQGYGGASLQRLDGQVTKNSAISQSLELRCCLRHWGAAVLDNDRAWRD
jgi:hypothetical protein